MSVDELAGCYGWDALPCVGAKRTVLARYRIDANVLYLVPKWACWLYDRIEHIGIAKAKNDLSIQIAIKDGLEWVACAPTAEEFYTRARAYVTAFETDLFNATLQLIGSTKAYDAPHRTWKKRWYE